MKFQISRDGLLAPVQQVIGVVERRQTLPILSNLLLQLKDGRLSITANDLEVELVAFTQVIEGEDGEITVPGRKMLDICKALGQDSNVEFVVKNDRATIRSGASRFTLSTLPAADYPVTEHQSSDLVVKMPQSVMGRLITKTQFCMAHQDVRYFLNGMLLELADGYVRAVATDGHRLAVSDSDFSAGVENVRQVIVPRKGVIELGRLLADNDDSVEIRLGANHIQVELAGIRFTSKLVDGRFPDYERVMPERGEQVLVSEKGVLKQALGRAAILSNEKYRGVRLELGADQLKIIAHNPEQEEAEETLGVAYQGDQIEIGFNVNYLTDALGAIDGDEVEVSVRDGNSSCLVQGTDDGSCRYVVMPMRL